MLDELSTVSGTDVFSFCNSTEDSLKIGLAEKSESASSYKREIFGGVLAQLILKVATGGTACRNCAVKVCCGKKGVLYHGRDGDMKVKIDHSQADGYWRIKNDQSQVDGLWRTKKLTRENVVGTKYVRVKANVKKERDKNKTLEQEYNDMVDEIAKDSL